MRSTMKAPVPVTERAAAGEMEEMAEKPQQLKRYFGFWTLLGLTASIMLSWEAVFFANATAMLNGGPPTMVYGFIYASLGALATAASLAEMASIWPTPGGQYHWCAMLAPPSQRAFLSWLCGWVATLGWIANIATGAFFAATMLQGIVVQTDASYVPQRWHGTLLIWAVLLLVYIINSLGTRLLSMIEGFIMVLHLTAFLAILVPLVYYSKHGSARDVFVTFNDLAGWKSNGLAWFVGLISANLPLIGYDGPVHLADEVRNAAIIVPWCMVGAVLINAVTGFAIVIGFSFCIVPYFEDALTSPTGFDYIYVFYQAVGSAGAAGMTSVIIVLMFSATIGFLATGSRQTWAFAVDGGLPFSSYFAKINMRLALPLRAITLCTILPALLALINIGSTVAFNAFVSITTAGLFLSYLIPIILIMIRKTSHTTRPLQYGPWSMWPGVGIFVNGFSVIFLVISIFFSFFPPAIPVTAVSMNWSCAVFGGFVVLGLAWFVVWGRKGYTGPTAERAVHHR